MSDQTKHPEVIAQLAGSMETAFGLVLATVQAVNQMHGTLPGSPTEFEQLVSKRDLTTTEGTLMMLAAKIGYLVDNPEELLKDV